MRIETDILKIIENGRTEGELYYLPKVQLDRKTYLAVNKVLEGLGGKWNKKAKAHVFDKPIEDAIENVILTGEVDIVDLKKKFQFFETPPELADELVELAEIIPGYLCLEPSAGKGRIAEALAKKMKKKYITCIDINSEFVEILKGKGFTAFNFNFMDLNLLGSKYDRIVMNPPFTKQQDIDHVEKALGCLKPGGILVSIMSAGIKFRQNKKTLAFMENLGYNEYEIIDVPKGAFKSSGTMVNTVILKVKKALL